MRLFVAFPIPREVAEACAALGARLPDSAMKRVRPELMHLTLAFIGEVPDGTAEAAARAIAEAATRITVFGARLGRAGAFPSERAPRVVWVGLAEGEPQVRQAALVVRAELTKRSVPYDDAPPVGHVTVARLRERVTPQERAALRDAFAAHGGDIPPLDFAVVEAHLVRSVLARSGPTYTTIARAVLSSAGQ